jgi:predicted ribonuclease YlaK
MSQYHFFPDTNFFVNYPDFSSQFLFDDEPFTVVVSTPVLVELDKLKKRDDSPSDRAYRARQAIRTIDELFRGKLVLAGGKGILVRYTSRLRGRRSFDHEIVDLVEQYQEEQPDGTKTVLLSDDANLRNYARGGAVLVEDPEEWLRGQTCKRRIKGSTHICGVKTALIPILIALLIRSGPPTLFSRHILAI